MCELTRPQPDVMQGNQAPLAGTFCALTPAMTMIMTFLAKDLVPKGLMLLNRAILIAP